MFKNNKVILFVLLIIVAFVGYKFLYKKDSSSGSDLVSSSAENNTGDEQIGKDLMEKLAMLKGLNIDDSLFKDKVFMSLTDFSVPIATTTKIGRYNPFAPIEREVSYSSSSSSSSGSASKSKTKK